MILRRLQFNEMEDMIHLHCRQLVRFEPFFSNSSKDFLSAVSRRHSNANVSRIIQWDEVGKVVVCAIHMDHRIATVLVDYFEVMNFTQMGNDVTPRVCLALDSFHVIDSMPLHP